MTIGCWWVNAKNRMVKALGGHTQREWDNLIRQMEQHEDNRVAEYHRALDRMEDLLKQAEKANKDN